MLRDPKEFCFSIEGYTQWLESLVGITARVGDDYGKLAAPSGTKATRAFLAGITAAGAPNSGCMVVQCGAVELFFTAHGKATPLASPVGLDRWHVMQGWASKAGALLAPGQWSPEPGDIVLFYAPPNHQHWIGLVAAITNGGPDQKWATVEAGWPLDGAYQCVTAHTQTLVRDKLGWHRIAQVPGAPTPVAQIVRMRTLIEKAA